MSLKLHMFSYILTSSFVLESYNVYPATVKKFDLYCLCSFYTFLVCSQIHTPV